MREKFSRDLARLEHRLALARPRPGDVVLGNGHAVFFRERAHRLGKRQPFDLHDEVEGAAAGAASEAMEKSALGIDRKRRRLLAMERAQADEVAPRAPQPHMRTDNL